MKRTLSVLAALFLAGCGTNARPQQQIPVSVPTSRPPVTTKAAKPTPKPTPAPTRKAVPPPVKVVPKPQPASVFFKNCAAARAAGAAPLHRGDPGYRSGLDRDGDGTACE